jgi:uncharacterized protein (DUF2141 family)
MEPTMPAPIRHAALLLALAFGTARGADLTIHVDNVRSTDGQVMVALFDDAGRFLKQPVRVAAAPAATAGATVVFRDVTPGEYGVAVFHDLNGNGRMDANPMGIPIEPIAFSNNAQGHMGPPAFDAARFAVPAAGLDTAVTLR